MSLFIIKSIKKLITPRLHVISKVFGRIPIIKIEESSTGQLKDFYLDVFCEKRLIIFP